MQQCPLLSNCAIAHKVGIGNKTVSRWRART